jgi:K+-transporting ATPase ATPase A chain
MEVIKLLGTNGGSFYGAGGAHPFENPTGFSNMFDLLLVIVLPFAIAIMFGRLIGRPRQGYAIAAVMAILFLGHTVVSMQAEAHGNHLLPATVSQLASSGSPGGNMEGKEMRFGPDGSALMTVGTMGTTAGATDSALDSYTPVGGAGAFVGILLGEVSPGGDGGGIYSMLVLALLAVFIAGLMVGRTPEFLGKKIRAPQMKLVVAYVLTIPIVVLVFGSMSLVLGPGTRSILNPGMHGLTEVTYAFASVANNNGSAVAGLSASTPWYDTTLGLVMLVGRFVPIVLALAIAGSLAGARVHARTRATLDTSGPTFVVFLLGVIVIVGGLIYFPMLILGPIGERIVG